MLQTAGKGEYSVWGGKGRRNGPRKWLAFHPEDAPGQRVSQNFCERLGKEEELCHSQRRFVKEKMCQMNLISSVPRCNKPRGWGRGKQEVPQTVSQAWL